MIQTVQDTFWNLVGAENSDLDALNMAARAVLTFAVTIAFLRIANKRLLGKGTAFDVVVSIMIGSVMSRAITGSSNFFATWVAGFTLIFAHWLLTALAARLDWFGPLVKGNRVELVKDGSVLEDAMTESGITTKEIEQAMRTNGYEPDFSAIKLASLERDGSISIVPKSSPPQVVSVSVEQGVQTVRIVMK